MIYIYDLPSTYKYTTIECSKHQDLLIILYDIDNFDFSLIYSSLIKLVRLLSRFLIPVNEQCSPLPFSVQ